MNAVTPDVLRRYLLGTAEEASRSEVEQRLFSDDQVFWERLTIAEDDLIDDYAAGELDDDERQAFESLFLRTDERRAKLEFVRALRTYAGEAHLSAPGFRAWLTGPLSVPRWAMAAAAALVLAVVPGLVWQFGLDGRAPAAVTVSLVPGLLRDAGAQTARVTPAPGCQVMHVDLATAGDRYADYAATIYDVDGEALWSQHRLPGTSRDGATTVRLTLPCELLPEGDYWARLSGRPAGGELVPLDRYDFRVLRD